MKNITGYTKLFALVGNPVKHSLSSAIHNYGFNKLDIDAVYMAFELENESKVGDYINAIRTLDMGGGNVTMPFKKAIMPYLDEITDEAKAIGAVNTIINENGKIKGYNTDGSGLMMAIKNKGVNITGSEVSVFGAGGAANSIFYAAAQQNAKKINIITRSSSSTESIDNVAEHINRTMLDCQIVKVNFEDTDNFEQAIKSSDILINATPIGMKPNLDSSPVEKDELITNDHVVVDVVYNPRDTKFLKSAKAKGCITIDGLDMLLWQALKGFELFSGGGKLPIEEIAREVFNENL